MERPPAKLHIFEDAVICGMIGGVIASLVGEPFVITALLCAISGPLMIFSLSNLLNALPDWLPGKRYGAYEFLFFAILVSVVLAIKE